ncbi:hypothetical protein [Chitinophaga qingshengii]|uniref:Uncharacterized protein n=1 Tax=Chitinophaga qingshengii TaxID=1569794 RepID=A0ABR7TNX6_9BACT|nr:hypothetical protein [Chitinophaga qingshengii]MBC9932180.1 hypothetical protein [Chitinophaga qingshengii]
MKGIFHSYTGNALLNASLMTVEAMAQLRDVTGITPAVLLRLYEEKKLPAVNRRLKNYSMLFTINGPLYYPDDGEVYDALFREIVRSVEYEGSQVCELSGLRFNRSFEEVYLAALERIGVSEKEIAGRDLSVNRVWIPLIGSLGSDAQALPQAKYMVKVHPVCIALLQFLPFSSLLYRGGILLMDSSDFQLARTYVAMNYQEMTARIEQISTAEEVPNVSYSKGHYMAEILKLLEEKEKASDIYADLNLWSFSNSGTGASCQIDRVPCSLLRRLYQLNAVQIRRELEKILRTEAINRSFLEALEDNQEWGLLYPNVFGVGKKQVNHKGVSIAFFETYMRIVGDDAMLPYARYIASLIREFKSNSFETYLNKTDAWRQKDYRSDLQAVLIKATQAGRWSLAHHLQLPGLQEMPIKGISYSMYRCIHFYYQQGVRRERMPPIPEGNTSPVSMVCNWLIGLIQQDELSYRIIADLSDPQRYMQVGYNKLLCRAFERPEVCVEHVYYVLTDPRKYTFVKAALNDLLRIFFNQPIQETFPVSTLPLPENYPPLPVRKWLQQIADFAADYQAYFYDVYSHPETDALPLNKYLRTVMSIPLESSPFMYTFYEMTGRTNDWLKNDGHNRKWSVDLLYSPEGDFSVLFAAVALKLSLLKGYHHHLSESVLS